MYIMITHYNPNNKKSEKKKPKISLKSIFYGNKSNVKNKNKKKNNKYK